MEIATVKYKIRGMIPEYPGKLAFIANDLVKTSPAYVTEEG
jgi:hypothetical protein